MFVYELNEPFVFDFTHNLKEYCLTLPNDEKEDILSTFSIAIGCLLKEDRRFLRSVDHCFFGAIPRELREVELNTWPSYFYIIQQETPKISWLISLDPWMFFKDEFKRRMNIRCCFMSQKSFESDLKIKIAEKYLKYKISI